jgi:hypothetical protein
MRHLFIALALLAGPLAPADAQVSFGIDIGVHVAAYPELVLVPGYPVYYDPRASTNYFYYDGLYWVYQSDSWYASSWYDGPWQAVGPESVPLFVLRVPVRYYRHPPVYFRGWSADAPPRWGEHWGRGWERRRGGWDRWDRRAAPRPAPLPVYQRQYSGDHYPRAAEQQHAIRAEKFRYRPREPVARQQYRAPAGQGGARQEPRPQQAPAYQGGARPERRPQPAPVPRGEPGAAQRPQAPVQQRPAAPQRAEPGQRRQEPQPARPAERAQPSQPARRPQPSQAPRQAPPPQPQRGRGESQERSRENRNEERGQDRR